MVLERTLGMMGSPLQPRSTVLDIGVSNSIVASVDMDGGEKVDRVHGREEKCFSNFF